MNGMEIHNVPGMQPQQATMMRPQQSNHQQQLHALIIDNLRKNPPPAGWQSTVDLRERANMVMQLVTNLRMLANQDVNKCLYMATQFEQRTIADSPSKEQYVALIRQKLGEITRQRQQNAQAQLMPPNNNNHNNNNNNNNAAANNMGMQQAGNNMAMQQNNVMFPNGVNMQQQRAPPPPQQGNDFPAHLQHPMQPSSIPPQNPSIDPSALQNPQQPQQPPQQNAQQQFNQEVMRMAQHLYNSTDDAQKNGLRAKFMANLSDQQRQQLMQNRGGDPLMKFFVQRAQQALQQKRNQAQQQGAQNQGMSAQQPTSQAPGIDMTAFSQQQQNALKLQDEGHQVVPASIPMQGLNQQPPNMGDTNASQGPVSGQGMNQMQQLIARQQQAQRLAQQQQQNAMRMGAAQQSGLQGQPGGLNAPNALNGGPPGGPQQSPAMSMLNRPILPPGAPGPSTPQPRPQSTPQMNQPTAQIMANALAQQHQSMLNQNQQNQPNVPLQIPNGMPPHVRDKLMAMPQNQAQNLLRMWQQQQHQNTMNQGQAGMPSMAAVNSQAPMNNMGNAVPDFNNPPPPQPQQGNGLPGQLDPQAQMLQKLAHQQQHRRRQEAMDIMPFPKQVLTELGISVPAHTQRWGELRMHIMQNQSNVPAGTLDKLHRLQQIFFQKNQGNLERAMNSMQQNGVPNQPPTMQAPNVNGAPPQVAPSGQAPTAQMVPPQAPMQPNQPNQPPNMGPGSGRPFQQMPSVNAQELTGFRQKYPAAQNMSDDQIRAAIMKQKINHLQKVNPALAQQQQQAQQAQQQALRAAQMQQALNQANGQRAPGQPGQGGAMNGARQPPPRLPPQPQNNGQMNQPQKRQSTNDDVMEIPNPNTAAQKPPQAAAMQPTRSQQPPPKMQMPNTEQLNSMPADKRRELVTRMQQMQQTEALKRAQNQSQNQQNPAVPKQAQPQQAQQDSPERIRLAQLFREVVSTTRKGSAVPIPDNATRARCQAILKGMAPSMSRINQVLLMGMQIFGEARIREIIRMKVIYTQNCVDAEGTMHNQVTLSLPQFQQMEQSVRRFFVELRQAKESKDSLAAAANVEHGQAQQPEVKPQTVPPAAPMARAPSTQNHNRKQSSSSKPPAAPTDANKTFDWGVQSPHGVPKYDYRTTELTQDKLKFPPNKKRKGNATGSNASTPANQGATPGSVGASPGLQKVPSPEQAKSAALQVRQQLHLQEMERKSKFRCRDEFCEASISGFETEDELKKHNDVAHQKIEDPLQFMLESAAAALDVDLEGRPLPVKPEAAKAKPAAQARTKVQSAANKIKSEIATPGIKQEGTTPVPGATPAFTGVGTPSSAAKAQIKTSASPPSAKPATTGPTSVPEAAEVHQKTLKEVMAEKAGFVVLSASNAAKVAQDITATGLTPPSDLFGNASDDFMSSVRASLSDIDALGFDDFTAVTDWGFRPEVPSPATSSSDQASEGSRASDLSENDRLRIALEWDPWGIGDTAVPEQLKTMTLQAPNGTQTTSQENVMPVAGDGPNKKDDAFDKEQQSNEADSWNINAGFDWDSVCGSNAASGGDMMDWDKNEFGVSLFEDADFGPGLWQ